MTSVVWKFPIPMPGDDNIILQKLPRGARPLHFDVQSDTICLWALVDPDRREDEELFVFRMALTGEVLGQDMRDLQYMNTMLRGNGIVLHFFRIAS